MKRTDWAKKKKTMTRELRKNKKKSPLHAACFCRKKADEQSY